MLAFSYTSPKLLIQLTMQLLEHGVIRDLALKLMCSYLTDHKQYVECNSVASEYQRVKCGIPQGSTLGPLLFSFYILMTFSFHKFTLVNTSC